MLGHGAHHLRDHAGFAGLDQLEATQVKGFFLDHVQDQAVAVVAGLDAVNLFLEFVGVFGDVGKGFDTGLSHVIWHGQGVFRAF